MDIKGLTDTDVKDRISKGEVNSVAHAVSRTYLDIIKKNVLTVFNLILFTIGALLIYIDELVSALAATGIILVNILIATIQEIRAKIRLDRIALLTRPKVTVIRDGGEREIDQSEIVKDDIIHMRSGDQALVDGLLLNVRSLEVDESLLTGESSTVRKREGDTIYSGSYCITGEGYYQVTAFGDRTFAAEMLTSAKKFDNKQSPLQMETGAVTKMLMALAMIYLIGMVALNILRPGSGSLSEPSNLMMAAIIIDIVPIGLFLMIVIAYMVAALRMSDSGILLQRSNSVESMSHVNTVCMDKTGTITTNRLVFNDITSFIDIEKAEHYARLFVNATGSRNKTADAILNKYGYTETEVKEEIMFSSERKYSAVKLIDRGEEISLFMGAYDVIIKNIADPKDLSEIVKGYSDRGLRTVVLAKADGRKEFFVDNEPILTPMELAAAIAIEDEVRPDCKEMIDLFIASGLEIRILSGDDPAAVNALFTIAGLPGERKILSGDELEELDGEERSTKILETNIFGRMKPDHKELVIEELKKNGRYVAMVGDGVNDVKSLKEAQVGIALQSGSGAARGVADMVLLGDNFSALPKALMEGNRTVSGMRDILKVFITRNFVLALMVFLTVMIFHTPPLVPITSLFYAVISLTLVSFFMVIWAKPSKIESSILPSVMKFAIPTAILVSLFGLLLYSAVYMAEAHELINVPMTQEEIDIFGWLGGSPEPIAEIAARNALLVFLTVTGLIQVLMVVPRFKFFSIDGKLSRDSKPTILVLLLFGLMLLAYWTIWNYDAFAEFVFIFILPPYLYAAVAGFIVIWFFVTRWVLRKGFLDRFTKLTERAYSFQLENMRKQEDQ